MSLVESCNATQSEQWSRVQGRIRSSVGEDVYTSWFARMDLESVQQEHAHLSVPTRFLKSWIQAHYVDRVLACLRAEMPQVHHVELTVRSYMKPMPPKEAPANGDNGKGNGHDDPPVVKTSHDTVPPMRTIALGSVSASHDALGGSPLSPYLTFASFAVGRTNVLAHAAARQVAEGRQDDPVMFNLLYIHAGTGLGKTHLLQAIAWAGNNVDRKVLYMTAEKFMCGFMVALKTQTMLAFKEALRSIDVLIIDDLQFLQGRSSQAEFCHTLNALMDSGRQVVIAADRPPNELEVLDDRLRSRLLGGLVVEIGPLGEELRLGILASRVAMAQAHHTLFQVPDSVLDYLAKNIVNNGRDLEGAVNRLLWANKSNGQPVTLEMAEREVQDLIRPTEPKRIRIEDIQRVVCRQYSIARGDMLSSRRTANIVQPRQIAMYLAKILTLRSLPEIGRRFGGRDHTTVLHGIRKIEALVKTDAALAGEIENLKKQLQD